MTRKIDQLSQPSSKRLHEEQYEVVENETLTNENLNGLTISGSLFSLTIFKNVTFESCVFFASKLENCSFSGCNFTNCTFQFTHLEYCNFVSVQFLNCKWDVSTMKKSSLKHCFLDNKTSYHLAKEDNHSENCFTSKQVSWFSTREEFDKEFDTAIFDQTQLLKIAA